MAFFVNFITHICTRLTLVSTDKCDKAFNFFNALATCRADALTPKDSYIALKLDARFPSHVKNIVIHL